MSTQFLKGGPGSGRHSEGGTKEDDKGGKSSTSKDDHLAATKDTGWTHGKTDEIKGPTGQEIRSTFTDDKGNNIRIVSGSMGHFATVNGRVAGGGWSQNLSQAVSRAQGAAKGNKSMKAIFDDALKGGPGSGRHAEVGGERQYTRQQVVGNRQALQMRGAAKQAGYEHKTTIEKGNVKEHQFEHKESGDKGSIHHNTETGSVRVTGSQFREDMGHKLAAASNRDSVNSQHMARGTGPGKSSSFKSLSDNIESRIDELSLKGGPGSGPHPGGGSAASKAEDAGHVAHAASTRAEDATIKAEKSGSKEDHAAAANAHQTALEAHREAQSLQGRAMQVAAGKPSQFSKHEALANGHSNAQDHHFSQMAAHYRAGGTS